MKEVCYTDREVHTIGGKRRIKEIRSYGIIDEQGVFKLKRCVGRFHTETITAVVSNTSNLPTAFRQAA